MQGYYNNPELTRETLIDGCLHTGDLACMDEENFVYVVDRKKFMIISGGYNVHPIEVENIIAEHPAVAAVCVFGIPRPKGVKPYLRWWC